MRTTTLVIGLGFVCALGAAGCISFEERRTGPSVTGLGALMGAWGSANLIPSPASCADFKWSVTEQTATSASGSFSATCAGDLKLQGTARGTLSGDVITWKAEGTASAPLLPSCAITLDGTAELGVDEIRIPYSGNTCLGPVSGVQTMTRR
jgi:hypothetical protein